MVHVQSDLLAVAEYVPVAVLVALAAGTAVAIVVLSAMVGPKRVGPVKHGPYESGMEPVGDTRRRFAVRFYLIAVLFLVFDVELVFLYPWAVALSGMRAAAGSEPFESVRPLLEAGYGPGVLLAGGGVFFLLLLVGLVYEWRRGVFKWN